MASWRSRLGPALGLIGVIGLSYAGSLDGKFISDDLQAVAGNPLLESLDGAHLVRIFTGFDGPNYMPLKVFSLALDVQLWGPGPIGFHLTNLLLHILTALLVYRILLRLELGPWPAPTVALLWAVHPLQVESVAWISERKNVLSGLFFCAAFDRYLSYSERPRPTTYLGLLACYVLALLSKMNTMVLPVVCLAYEASFRFRLRRRDGLASLPMFALAALVAAYNLLGNPVHGGPYHGGSALVTWLSSSVVVLRYIAHAFLPTQLSFYYDVPLRGSLLDPSLALSLLALLALGAASLWGIRRRQRAAFWALWFGITLLPMLNLIPFRGLMHDRYMYLSLLGPLVLVALGLDALARSRSTRYAAAGVAAAAVVGCVFLTVQRVEAFHSPQSLWEDWALRVPYLPGQPHVSRGPDPKLRALRAEIARNPDSAVAHANLGARYYETRRPRQAIRELERALELEPEHRIFLANLGRGYTSAGQLERGARALARAAELDPHSFVTHYHLARVQLERGDLEGARSALAVCERIRPAESRLGNSWALERKRLAELETLREGGR